MSETKEKDTEKLILDAAMKVFTQRGFDGARTEDIAKEAGINRALLHYYFRDKQTMFNMIFEERFRDFFGGIFKIFSSDQPLLEKIKLLIDHEITMLLKHPDLARFIITEVANKPERLIEQGQKLGVNPRVFIETFEKQLSAEIKAGNVKPIPARQLLMNIMSLCIYPFVAQPIIRTMMQLDKASFNDMMEARKKEAYEFIVNAIKPYAMKRLEIFLLAMMLVFVLQTQAQTTTLTLEQCYELARQNYPLIKQKELYAMSKDFSITNAHAGYMPQVAIYGQATYQSDVTQISIDNPMFPKIEPLSKDQYKVYAEVSQNLYDGGTIKRTSALHETNALINDQQLEIELYKIKDRINQIYFGILLLDQQLAQVELLKKDIQASSAKVKASIENGTAFRMNADILEAESLKTGQRIIEIKASRKAFLAMLSLFVKQDLPETTTLAEPKNVDLATSEDITRPELSLFNYQRQLARSQFELTSTRNMPRAGVFLQGGYGKPGLNMLKNEFDTYYLGGLRLSWNLSGFYNANREKQLLDVNTRQVDVQQETFTFNTNLSLRQTSSEVTKLQELIEIDEQLISLRAKIKETAKAQLDNGVISANDYLRELNAEDQVKQNQLLHKTQLVMAVYNYNTTSGK